MTKLPWKRRSPAADATGDPGLAKVLEPATRIGPANGGTAGRQAGWTDQARLVRGSDPRTLAIRVPRDGQDGTVRYEWTWFFGRPDRRPSEAAPQQQPPDPQPQPASDASSNVIARVRVGIGGRSSGATG